MQQQDITTLQDWVAFLGNADIPVLRQTARNFDKLHGDAERVSARSVSEIVMRDPMMTTKLLRYLQHNRRRRQEHEVVEVEQALLMMGVEAFFTKLTAQPLVEDVLRGQMDALVCLLRVLHRAHRASAYAFDWAVRLRDLHYEEVRIAALLHDLAEMLMWCFAPTKMLQVHVMQQKDKTLRSHTAQEAVFGFTLTDLQRALSIEWKLPRLLVKLMDEEFAQQSRVRNVVLAVNLARHSANGWDDTALPDDYKDIGALLRMSPEDVMEMLDNGRKPSA